MKCTYTSLAYLKLNLRGPSNSATLILNPHTQLPQQYHSSGGEKALKNSQKWNFIKKQIKLTWRRCRLIRRSLLVSLLVVSWHPELRSKRRISVPTKWRSEKRKWRLRRRRFEYVHTERELESEWGEWGLRSEACMPSPARIPWRVAGREVWIGRSLLLRGRLCNTLHSHWPRGRRLAASNDVIVKKETTGQEVTRVDVHQTSSSLFKTSNYLLHEHDSWNKWKNVSGEVNEIILYQCMTWWNEWNDS